MYYMSENDSFRFTDGMCESLPGADISSTAAAEIGRRFALRFLRICAGCDSFSHIPQLYALCSGIAEAGSDVYVCENTDMPSLRFSYPLLSADCGIFISGNGCLRINVFGKNRLSVPGNELTELLNNASRHNNKCGRIYPVTSFMPIYTGNIRTALGSEAVFSAGVSCGSRSVRELWNAFFSGDDDSISFQVSSDGQKVNAFTAIHGMITDERLRLAYALMYGENRNIFLPESFHFAAEDSGIKISRFSSPDEITDEFSLRMLTDPLFVCTHLMADRQRFYEALKHIPDFASVRREVTISFGSLAPFRRIVQTHDGRIILSRSGRDRLALSAQAYSLETASEICDIWSDKLKRMYGGGGVGMIPGR